MKTETPATDGEFDPSRVPPYPVITLTGADDPSNVTVDQQKIEGEDAYDQALAICAQRAADLGGAVRVRGVAADGTEWPLAITSAGELYELPQAASGPQGTGRRGAGGRELTRRQALTLAGLGGLVLTAGGAVGGAVAWKRMNEPEAPPPPQRFPGKNSNLPVIPPSGYAAQAAWAVVIDGQSTPQVMPDGRVLLTTPSSTIALVNGSDGQLQWSGAITGKGNAAHYLPMTIKGAPFLVGAGSNGMDAWPLKSSGSAQHVSLAESSATAIASSPTPLFVLQDQSAQFLAGGDLVTVDVPVPAVAAGMHGEDAVAAAAQGWYSITAKNQAHLHPLADVPPDATATNARVLGAEHLAVIWETPTDAIMTLHLLPDGTQVSQSVMDDADSANTNEPLSSPHGGVWAWGGMLIRPEGIRPLSDFRPEGDQGPAANRIRPETVTATTVWGMRSQDLLRIDLAGDLVTAEPPEAVAPMGTSADGKLAYIVADKLGETILYAVPQTAASDQGGAS